jgi:biotin carboxylase
MGFVNTEVLAQEFLVGDEYVVDTVSSNGHHFVCDIIYNKKQPIEGHAFIYEDGIFISHDSPQVKNLAAYTLQALEALKIQHGPTHCEVMLTKDGPCLIELNARLHGGGVPAFMPQCLEHGQLELSADAFLDPNVFSQRTKRPFVLKQHGRFLHFISTREGCIKDIRFLDKIRSLPSCFNIILNVRVGEQLKKTVDLDTDPGWVILSHSNPAVIQRDYNTIRTWEKEGIFILA